MDLQYLQTFRDNKTSAVFIPLPREAWMPNGEVCRCEYCEAVMDEEMKKQKQRNLDPRTISKVRRTIGKKMHLGALDTLMVPLCGGQTLMVHYPELHTRVVTTNERYYQDADEEIDHQLS
jgi:hypothetical protein